ncbi:MAG: hypothetical protein ABIG11_06020 [bacterium]
MKRNCLFLQIQKAFPYLAVFIPGSLCLGTVSSSYARNFSTGNKTNKPNRVLAGSFTDSYAANRLITPNSDGRNDTFVFRFYNPRGVAASGNIFSVSGAHVAGMKSLNCDASLDYNCDLEWNPNADGQKVQGGVYLYQIIAEGNSYTGTVVVVR